MTKPDLLDSTWKRLAWFGSGGVCGGVLVAVWTATFSSCCAMASPSSCPEYAQDAPHQPYKAPIVTVPVFRESVVDRLLRIEQKLNCAECAVKEPNK